jgi:predicted 3-demethylubiquinone-9 3-methyltransferase (glyoxalase superfamily)
MRDAADEFSPAGVSLSTTADERSEMPKPTPCLWFDTQGLDAARFYTSVFPNSRIVDVARYGAGGPREEGTVMVVSFELDGQPFTALNGGPQFTFSEAVSFHVECADQAEVDRYWETLSEGGEQGPCGWLKDRFGLSWQIVPTRLYELLRDSDRDRAQRVMQAMLGMGKIEIAGLEAAA